MVRMHTCALIFSISLRMFLSSESNFLGAREASDAATYIFPGEECAISSFFVFLDTVQVRQ
jgi:hypothetical protein